MDNLFKTSEQDIIRERLSKTDSQKSKTFKIYIITEDEPLILTSENKNKIVNLFLPEIQKTVGDGFLVSSLLNDDDPKASKPYVKIFLEEKNGPFAKSGLSAPYFELAENPDSKVLEGRIKTSGKTSSEVINLSDPKNLNESFKEVFTAFLDKYEAEYSKI